MVSIKCAPTGDEVLLTQMVPFQGELKKRNDADIAALAASIECEGLLMPFALWHNEGTNKLLDGHARMQALTHLAFKDPSILQQTFPCVKIDAPSEDDARKALLQITSTCGRFNRKGVVEFAAPLIDYKAPVLDKVKRAPIKRETSILDGVIIRVCVDKVKAKELIKLLSTVEGVEVL